MAEAFNTERRGRFKLKSKVEKKSKVKKDKEEKVPNESTYDVTNQQYDTGFEGASGYILEDGNLIAIDEPSLNSVNKFAIEIIKV